MIEQVVKQVSFFSELNDDELREVVESGYAKHLGRGELLFTQGDPGDHLYVIIEGRIRIFSTTGEEEVTLSTLEKGAFVGEMALIDGGPRSASARTLTPCQLFVLEREDFFNLLTRSTHILSEVMRVLTAKIRVLGQDFVVTSLQKRHVEDQAEIDRHRAISQMVAGVAHEINTPIGIAHQGATFISETLTQTLIAKLAGDPADAEALTDVVDAAQLVRSSTQRADKLIKSFRNLSVRQIVDAPESVDLRDLVEEIFVLCPAQIKGWNLTIEVVDDLGDERIWTGYPGLLTQVMLNLIINAQTHAYPAGTPGSVQIVLTTFEERYCIELRDFGRGMSDEVLKQVFTAFYTTKRGQGGTGLGLAIVHNIVTNALQGKIKMDSELGCGTSVTISFPKRLKATVMRDAV